MILLPYDIATTKVNLIQPRVVLLSVRKTTTPHHTTDVITIRAVLGNLGSWLCYLNLNMSWE